MDWIQKNYSLVYNMTNDWPLRETTNDKQFTWNIEHTTKPKLEVTILSLWVHFDYVPGCYRIWTTDIVYMRIMASVQQLGDLLAR